MHYSGSQMLKWYDVWVHIEQSMDYQEKKDQQISGFMICLRTKPTGEDFVKIDLP